MFRGVAADRRACQFPQGTTTRTVEHFINALANRLGHRDVPTAGQLLEAPMLCGLKLNLSFDHHGMPSFTAIIVSGETLEVKSEK